MPLNDDVSHGDIYHKLGTMEGKLESVLIQLAEKRSDMTAVFSRLREVEVRLAAGVGIAAVVSVVLPLVVTMIGPKIHLPVAPIYEQVR